MTMLLIAAALGAVAAGGTMVVRALRPSGALDRTLADLDGDGVAGDPYGEALATPLPQRMLGPVSSAIARRAAGLLPNRRLESLRERLVLAGLAGRMSAEEFLTIQVGAVVGGFLLAALAVSSTGVEGARQIAVGVLTVGIGAFLPTAWLTRKREERVDAIRRDLPDVLDLLAVSVEGGLGLEGALEVATSHFDTPLAREIGHTLREMQLGLTRRQALHNLRQRTQVGELSGFVLSLLQADTLGMPLSRVLQTQARVMRSRRRQAARETAAKLPVKMLIPLTLFILPAIFVVVLGPAAIQIFEALR